MKIENDETKTIKQFIVTLVIVILIAVGIYFFTDKIVKKTNTNSNGNTTEETSYIDPNATIVGTMLKKSESEYYVLLTKSTSDNYSSYTSVVSTYTSKTDSLKVYLVDLSSTLNSKYYTDDENSINTTSENLNDLKFGEVTLLKIKDGKITKSYTTLESIEKVLK